MERRELVVTLSLAGLATQAFNIPQADAREPSPAHHVIEQFAATLSAHDIGAFAALFAETYVNHHFSAAAPPPPGITPKNASVAFFAGRLKGLPNLKVTIEASVVSGNMAAASFLYEGTQTGVFLGLPATGRQLRFTSCDIFRIVDGKIAEHWGMGDIAGVMAQLKA